MVSAQTPFHSTHGIEHLNDDCTCRTLDADALCAALTAAVGDPQFCRNLIETHPHLVSRQPVFLTHEHAAAMSRTIEAVEAVALLPEYRKAVLQYAPAIAHHAPGPIGVFMGYDFHLGRDGPKLIEINTNAGGGIVNAFVARAQRACCSEMQAGMDLGPFARIEDRFVESFAAECSRQDRHGAMRTIAIVDLAPDTQYLYPEFVLFKRHLESRGLSALIADPRELSHRDGGLWCAGQRIDVVYNRLTDFYLAEVASAAVRSAYLAGDVVVTPNPRAHALHANKRNLAVLTDAEMLRDWGAGEDVIAALRAGIPRTVVISTALADELWARRSGLFFKPASGYGSKAAYRGDKITKRVWAEILAGDYVAQEIVQPSTRAIAIDGRREALKVDFRNFTYDGRVQLLAARLYQGQTTNFRTPGGGFAPVFVSGDADCSACTPPDPSE